MRDREDALGRPQAQAKEKRKGAYDGQVKTALVKAWEIFEYPYGQRLKSLIKVEVDRLTECREVEIRDDIALKRRVMSSVVVLVTKTPGFLLPPA